MVPAPTVDKYIIMDLVQNITVGFSMVFPHIYWWIPSLARMMAYK